MMNANRPLRVACAGPKQSIPNECVGLTGGPSAGNVCSGEDGDARRSLDAMTL